jgi:hypothetical protein
MQHALLFSNGANTFNCVFILTYGNNLITVKSRDIYVS